MIINYLELENFKSYSLKTRFELEVTNRDQNIVLIEALNGIGKTSFLQAVSFAYFGMGKSDFDRFIPYGKKDKTMLIEIEFYNTNNYKKYKVHREYSYNENKTAINSLLQISIDDVVKSEFDESKWRLFLQTEFPAEISQFFFFDGEKIQQIIDYKNPREIKSAIEKILGIEEVRNLKENLHQIRSSKIRRYGLEKNDTKTKSLNLQLEDITEKKKELTKQIGDNNKKIETLSRQIILLRKDIDSLLASGLSEGKLEKWQDYKNRIAQLETKKEILENQIEDFLNNNLDSFLLTNKIQDLAKQFEQDGVGETPLKFESVSKILKDLYFPTCLNCGTDFNVEKYAIVEKRLRELLESNSNNSNHLSKKNVEEFITASRLIGSKTIPDISKTLGNIESIEIEVSEISRELNALGRASNTEEQIDQLQGLRGKEVDLVTEKTKSENLGVTLLAGLEEVNKKVSEIEFELESLMKTSAVEKIERDAIDLVGNIISALEEYIAALVIEKRQNLKERTEEMFMLLSNTEKYSRVEISEDYKVSIFDTAGNEQTELSSGFKQILMTSLIWGLKECSEKNIPIIIDTPLARLDPIHRKHMLTKYFPIAAPQVIILSQPTEITQSDIEDQTWNKHLREGKYIQMNYNDELGSTVLEDITI